MVGFYKGMASPLAGQVFINATIFGVQGTTLRRLNDQGVKGQFISGAVAGGVQAIICCPMELVKTRLQLQGLWESWKEMRLHLKKSDRFSYTSPVDCIEKIYRYEGIRGVYRGMSCTLMRELPAFGIYFSSYYSLCGLLNANDGKLNIGKLLLCGGLSGIFSWMLTYPIDFMKTRLQIDGMGKNMYNGILDCAVKSYKQEGYKVFFKGLNATLIRAFPTNAATLATVTVFLSWFQPELMNEFFKPQDHYNYEHVRPGWSI